MASDNGKPGVVDFYDVACQIEYLERKYDGTVQLNLSQTTEGSRYRMLLCTTFVGNESGRSRVAGSSIELPLSPGTMRSLPEVAHQLLFDLQENVDDLKPGEARLTY